MDQSMKNTMPLPATMPAKVTVSEKLLSLALGSMVSCALWKRQIDEAEMLYAAARRLWADAEFLQPMEPFILIASGRHLDALSSVAGRNDTLSIAARANCMYRMGELSWEEVAKEVLLRNDSMRASEFVRSLFKIAGRPVPETDAIGEASKPRDEMPLPLSLSRMRA